MMGAIFSQMPRGGQRVRKGARQAAGRVGVPLKVSPVISRQSAVIMLGVWILARTQWGLIRAPIVLIMERNLASNQGQINRLGSYPSSLLAKRPFSHPLDTQKDLVLNAAERMSISPLQRAARIGVYASWAKRTVRTIRSASVPH